MLEGCQNWEPGNYYGIIKSTHSGGGDFGSWAGLYGLTISSKGNYGAKGFVVAQGIIFEVNYATSWLVYRQARDASLYWSHLDSGAVDGGGDVDKTFTIPKTAKIIGFSLSSICVSTSVPVPEFTTLVNSWYTAGFIGPYALSMLKGPDSSSGYTITRLGIRNIDGTVPSTAATFTIHVFYQ